MKKFILSFLTILTFGVYGQVIFDVPGTYSWTVPPCVTEITVQVWGGGGGGGAVWSRFNTVSGTGSNCESGDEICAGAGGGGGGGFAQRTYTVVPGDVYTIVVGAGGAGGTASAIVNGANPGSPGGFSRFTGPATITPGALTANGGNGGGAANIQRSCNFGCSFNHNGENGVGGTGGTGVNGTINFIGGSGSIGSHSSNSNDRSGGGGGAAGPSGAGGNAIGVTTGGIGNAPGGNGANGISQAACNSSMCGANGNAGVIIGGAGSGAVSHNRNSCGSSGNNHTFRIGGNGARGEVRITFPEPGADLLSNGSRIAPLGPMCSGSTLNFVSNPTGGDGNYEYSWSTTPASSTSTSSTFSPILTNTGCTETTYTINLSVTSCGVTRNQTFSPTIRPIPSLNGNPPFDCVAATVDLNNANINACSGCTGCSYTLTSCIGCSGASDPVGTSNTTGDFTLNGASSATFTVTTPPAGINTGCVSAPASYDFLLPPFDCVSPLPVELAEFNVQCEQNQNVFSWYVLNEINNDFFTIQKSRDGVNYVTLDQIQSQLYSNAYVYQEQMPENGEFYYRILQTDFDGSSSVLSTLSHSFPCEDNEDIEIYPNPTDENAFITISAKESDVKIEVFNALGQIVIDKIDFQFKQQETKVFALNTEFLSDGIYMIKVSIDEKLYVKKLVKE